MFQKTTHKSRPLKEAYLVTLAQAPTTAQQPSSPAAPLAEAAERSTLHETIYRRGSNTRSVGLKVPNLLRTV